MDKLDHLIQSNKRDIKHYKDTLRKQIASLIHELQRTLSLLNNADEPRSINDLGDRVMICGKAIDRQLITIRRLTHFVEALELLKT
jgi:hypothetical protein